MTTRELSQPVIKTNDTESYFFQFRNLGWTEVLLNETTGLFLIYSDLGTFGYHWPSRSRERTLKQFIAQASPAYIVEKFGYGREFKKWDPQETKNLLKDTARELCDIDGGLVLSAILEEIEDAEWEMGSDIFYFSAKDKLHHIFNPLHEYIIYSFKPNILFLRDELLPAIQKYFKKEF